MRYPLAIAAALFLGACGGTIVLGTDGGGGSAPDCGALLPVGAPCDGGCACCSGVCIPGRDGGGACQGPCPDAG